MSEIIIIDDLIEEMNNFKNQKDVAVFIKKYKSIDYLSMILMNHTDELRRNGKHNTANLIYLELESNKDLKYIYDDVTLLFRLGEYYINNGEIEKGKSYLIKLCDRVSNYEESFEFRELTEDWQRLKPYVVNEIEPSIVLTDDTDDEPMTEDKLLELFLEEMASGGIHAYLTNYGNKLEDTLAAAKRRKASATIELLELIKAKYFKGQIPKKIEEIESLILKNDWRFEEEYDKYYYRIEKELC